MVGSSEKVMVEERRRRRTRKERVDMTGRLICPGLRHAVKHNLYKASADYRITSSVYLGTSLIGLVRLGRKTINLCDVVYIIGTLIETS